MNPLYDEDTSGFANGIVTKSKDVVDTDDSSNVGDTAIEVLKMLQQTTFCILVAMQSPTVVMTK